MTLPAGLQAPTRTKVTVSQPAAGADWSYTVPAGTWLKLMSGLTTLTCSATTAQRNPGTIITDGTKTIGRLEYQTSGANPKASSVCQISYVTSHNWQVAGNAQIPANGPLCLSLPPFVLPPGYVIGSVTPNLQAGDQYSAVTLIFGSWTQAPYIDAYGPMWRPR